MAQSGASVDVSRIRDRVPLQTEIRNTILADYILSGAVAPGQKLPSEHELVETFRASRVTIRGALQSLKDQGYIRVVRGSGSLVLPRPEAIASGIDRLVSFDEFARSAAQTISTEDVLIEQVAMAPEDIDTYGVEEPLTRIARTKVVNDRRVGYIVDDVPKSTMEFEELRERFEDSVLDLLLEREGLVAYTDCTLAPSVLDESLGAKLDQPPDGAFLVMSELTRSATGQVVNRSTAWISPEFFTFHLRRRLSS